jgi:alpha-D-ribose 1-methylphosphonate 5-triphosphate synthase subunit PhnG
MAQPCEKPATTMRLAAMPRAFSLAMSGLDGGLRAAQAGLVFLRGQIGGTAMSYQAGIW